MQMVHFEILRCRIFWCFQIPGVESETPSDSRRCTKRKTPAYYNRDMRWGGGFHGSFASSGIFYFLRSDVKFRRLVHIHGVLNWYSNHLEQITEGEDNNVYRLPGKADLYATQGLRREYSEVTHVPLPHRRESVDSNEVDGNSGRHGIT
ncbi:hypothetical protein J6590_089786 [Homalodisca vitripennis]|nr:hypothetical protein J6590_089786 [Homalodisca vitripennis]